MADDNVAGDTVWARDSVIEANNRALTIKATVRDIEGKALGACSE
jgi:hypothetical protein